MFQSIAPYAAVLALFYVCAWLTHSLEALLVIATGQ
jgi:hypothetical protein